ncbi:MAG: long-chain fatty acid--CoA ligase [Bacteroidota bacterium]
MQINFQIDWLAKWAKYTPNRMFLREHERELEWTYFDFNMRANSLTNFFADELKIKKGDRIAVYSKNRAEYLLLLIASIKSGAIFVPLNFRLTPRELDILLNDAEPQLFIYEDEYHKEVGRLETLVKIPLKKTIQEITHFLTESITNYQPLTTNNQSAEGGLITQVDQEDPVMILYTAGTTGLPKGAIINHRMLFWNSINTALRLDITTEDHTQSFAPFFHTGGLNVLLTPFIHHGASHTLLTKFDADLILQLMEKERTTILFGVPTMFQMMADSPLFKKVDLSSVRYAIVGGAPMPIPLINIWHEKGVFIRQGYGLTEVGPNVFSLHQNDAVRKKGSIGFPNFYFDLKIVDENGTELGINEVGELWLKSPAVTPGYWRKPEETAKSITDGWFHTGDMVMKDDEGYFFVVDRKKNMFISGGENVYPAEIEKFLLTHPAIKEAAVIGVPDEKWGEVGAAYIVVSENVILNGCEVSDFCKGKLAKYKTPKYFEIVKEIPKNDAGKTDKKKLLALHQNKITNH